MGPTRSQGEAREGGRCGGDDKTGGGSRVWFRMRKDN